MKTTLTIKTDSKLRDEAKKTAKKLGIPLTTVINAQLAEFVREGRFEVSLTPRKEKMREWDAIAHDYATNPALFTRMSLDDLIAELS